MMWFCLIGGYLLFVRFHLQFPLTAGLIQTAILAALTGLNFFYLFYILYKMNEDAAIILVVIFSLVWLAFFVYSRVVKDVDTGLGFVVILGGLITTTAIVQIVRRSRSQR
jgi:hypothetical protein